MRLDVRLKGVSSLFFKKKLLLIIYSLQCYPRCPCLSFFSLKERKDFDENIPGFSPYNGLGNQMVQGPNESFSAASKGFKRHQTMNKGLI